MHDFEFWEKTAAKIVGADSVPSRQRALAVWGGEWGAIVSGNVEEGVEEEVSDAFPQGGRLDQDGRLDQVGRQDAVGGAGGVEAQYLLVPQFRRCCRTAAGSCRA